MLTTGSQRRCAFAAFAALACFVLPSIVTGQAPRQWKIEPIAQLEGFSADDPFGVIRGLALHADGRLVVTELKPKRVSMFDGNGKSLGLVGRIGGGPAEYRDPYSAAWLGDTLAIYDPGESRVLYMTQGKTHLRSETTLRFTGPGVRFFPVTRTKAYLQTGVREGNQIRTAYIGFGGGGKRDTVLLPDMPQLPSGTGCKMSNKSIRVFSWPNVPKSIGFPVRADGAMAVGNTGQYDVRVQLGGNTLATLARKDFVPMPMPDALWRGDLHEYQQHVDQFGAASCDVTPVRPPHVSPIVAMTVADNGDIWMTVRGKEEYAYNVFSRDGRFLAAITPPKGATAFVPIVVTGDRIAYVSQDRDDVQYVNIARIVR